MLLGKAVAGFRQLAHDLKNADAILDGPAATAEEEQEDEEA